MAKAIVFFPVGQYDPNGYSIYTGTDAAVDAEWTVLSATTPGIMSSGIQTWYAIKYSSAVLNTPPPGTTTSTILQSGTIDFTYGGSPKIPGSYPVTLAAGANNDIPCLGFANVVTGPAGVFNITGIAGGFDGKQIQIINNVAQNMTITDDSAASVATNRIYTYGATVTTGTGVVNLTYVGSLAHWVVTSFTA